MRVPTPCAQVVLLIPAFLTGVLSQSSAPSATSQPSPASSTVAAPQASVSVNPGNSLFTYQGCFNETTGFSENGGQRALMGSTITVSSREDMTVEQCLSYCGSEQYAGLEYGRECWCGKFLSSLANKLLDNECNAPCSGAKSTACGGQLKLTLYLKTGTVPPKKGAAESQFSVSNRNMVVGVGAAVAGAFAML